MAWRGAWAQYYQTQPRRAVGAEEAGRRGPWAVLQPLSYHEEQARRGIAREERAVAEAWPKLAAEIEGYFADLGFDWRGVLVLEGGEAVKNDDELKNYAQAAARGMVQ